MIRYADDFVVCFQSQKEAKEFGEALGQRLGKFGLKIAKGLNQWMKNVRNLVELKEWWQKVIGTLPLLRDKW